MNILINGFVNAYQLSALRAALLQTADLDVFHICKNPLFTDKDEFAGNYHFIRYNDVHDAKLVGSEKPAPVDAVILDALAHHEADFLKMLDRVLWRNWRYKQYDIRKHLYYTMLSFWLGFFKEHKIDRVICHNIPHEGYDYIIYMLCEHFDIPVKMFYQLQVVDAIVAAETIDGVFDGIATTLSGIPAGSITVDQLSARMKSEYDLRMADDVPFYMKKKKVPLKRRVQKFFKKRLRLSCKERHIYREISGPCDKYTTDVDLNQPYIYYGLHYQPELTTCPLGGRYVDQYLSIKLLSDRLPKDVLIYVKEHPAMYGTDRATGRFFEFYEMLHELENVRLVSISTDSNTLIENCVAVATITGTVGWEALFRNKPVFVFGNVFYKFCQGCFLIHSTADLDAAIESIFNNGFKVDPAELLRYMEAIDRCSLNGVIDIDYLAISNNSESENIQALTAAIIRCMA